MRTAVLPRFWSRPPLWSAALLLASTAVLHADGMRIVPLVRDGSVLVSFELADAYTDEVREVIRSGLKTTFTYSVDLRLEVPIWIDRIVGSAVVTNSVEYDNLTRRHTLVRTVDGRVEQALVTEDEGVVRQLMTSFERLPLFRTTALEPNREYYVRVHAQARPRASLWPWEGGPSGQAKFTFIP